MRSEQKKKQVRFAVEEKSPPPSLKKLLSEEDDAGFYYEQIVPALKKALDVNKYEEVKLLLQTASPGVLKMTRRDLKDQVKYSVSRIAYLEKELRSMGTCSHVMLPRFKPELDLLKNDEKGCLVLLDLLP